MKNILCFGDSNVYGYIPGDGHRYPRDVRWTGVIERQLGPEYHVIEEGLNGRTTAFVDNLQPWSCGLGAFAAALRSHAPLDAVLIMLGTNDTKRRYGVSAAEIGTGLHWLLREGNSFFRDNARWAGEKPPFIVVSPVPMAATGGDPEFDQDSLEKQATLAPVFAAAAKEEGALFANAAEWVARSNIGSDFCHYTPAGHLAFAAQAAALLHQLQV